MSKISTVGLGLLLTISLLSYGVAAKKHHMKVLGKSPAGEQSLAQQRGMKVAEKANTNNLSTKLGDYVWPPSIDLLANVDIPLALWSFPVENPNAAKPLFVGFPFYGVLVRVSETGVTFINVTTGAVFGNLTIQCPSPNIAVDAGGHMGYYGCSASSVIVVFNALTAQQVALVKLTGEFSTPATPKDDTDDRGISEYVPFYQNDVLLLTVQHSGDKVSQGIVGVNLKTPSTPQIYPTLTFDKECNDIVFQNIQRSNEDSETLSAFVACSNGLLFSVADITKSDYTKASLSTSYFRITPVLTKLPNATYGKFSTVYVAYSASDDATAIITVEQRSTLDGSVVAGSTITLSREQNPSCGDPTAIGGFVGRSVIVNEVFFFMSPCTLYSVAVPNSAFLYSIDVGVLGTYRDMYFSGTIDYIITTSTEQNLMILDVASGILQKASHFATMGDIVVRPFLMYNALHNPGHITPTYSNFRVGVAVLTGSNLYVIDLSNFNSDVRVASNIKPDLPPMWFPLHNVLVMVGSDGYTMAVSTQFGRQFNIESKVATQNGAVLATLYDQEVSGLYVFAVDLAGHAMWRSKDVFTTLSDPVPIMNRYVLVARRTTLAILDGMSGETIQMIDMTTGCVADQPLSRFTFLLNTENFVSSADGKRVYFTMGTYCVYVLEETLQLTAFTAPLMTVGPPILDEANHKIILYNGASYVTIDTLSGKSSEAQALGEEIVSATPLSTVTVPSTAPETVVIVTTAHAVYAQDHLRPSSSTIWSYFFPSSSVIESRPLFFNNHLYLKVDTSMVKLSLDPTIPPEKRVLWNASCADNMHTKPAAGKVPLVATTAGAIVLQFQNELYFYSETDGSVLLQRKWYCEDGTDASDLKFFPQQYFIAAICQHSAHLLDGLTGAQSLVAFVQNAMDVVLYEDAVIMVGGRSFSTAVLPAYLTQRSVPNTTVAPAPAVPTLPADASLPPHQTAPPAHFDGSRVAPYATRTTPYVNKYITTDTNKVASWGLAFAIQGGNDHRLHAVDVTTTLPVWSSGLNTSLCSASATMTFGATVEQGSVLLSCVSSVSPYFVGINATTGELLWENKDISPPHMMAGFDETADAIVANGNTVARINALTGATVWSVGTNFLKTLMVINHIPNNSDNATVLVVDTGNNFTAISFATGATTATIVESTCSVLAVIEVQNQLNQGYHLNGLSEVFYQCDDDIRIFDLATGNKEVVIKDIGEVPLFVSLTPDLGQLMISLPKSFKLWDVKTKVFLYTYNAPDKSMFMGVSAATEQNIIVLLLDTDNINGDVQFAALPKTGDGNTVQSLWFVDSGPNVGHISGNRLAGIVPISGNVMALLCGISYILDVSSGFMMAQMTIDSETAHVYKATNRSFIEGTTIVSKTLDAIALVGDHAMISVSVQPGDKQFGFMYYNALSTVDSIVVNGTHYTVLGDSIGTIALAEDNGKLKWQTLGGGRDAMAPLNVLGVGAVTGSDGVGYLGVFHTNGINLLNVLTGELIAEIVGLRSSVGLNGFSKRDIFLPYGDSFYVAAREFLLRYDPVTRKMMFAEVSNIVEPIERIGCFSSDQSVVTVVTNRGSILGINTTTMDVLWLCLESRLDAQLRGTVTPSAAFRKIALRGSASADKEIFIAYNAALNKFDYISYATGEVQMRLSLGSHTIESYSVSRDGMLYIANGLGIAKFTNELTNDTSGVGHIWAKRLPDYQPTGIPYVPKIVEVPNMGVVVVAYSCRYLVTLRASDGEILTRWEGNQSFYTPDCEVFAPSQGIDDPLTADVLLLYNDVNPSAPVVYYRRATLGDEENYAAVDGVSLEASLFQDDLYVYYYVQHNGIGLLPILVDTTPSNTTGLTPTPYYDVRIPDGFKPLDFHPKPQPFTPATASVRRAARVWSTPSYNEELSVGYKTEHYFAATIEGTSVAISMTSMWETGTAFINYTFALNGSIARDPHPITFATSDFMWLGRLNSQYGAYFTKNLLVGFSLSTMTMAEVFNHSGLSMAPRPIGLRYPDGTLIAPITTADGAVSCLVMKDDSIVCIQLAQGDSFGHVVVISSGLTIQTAPQLYEDKYIAVATKGSGDEWAVKVFNIRTGDSVPSASSLPSDSDAVQQTTRYAVAYKSNSATAYHFNGTATGWPTTSFPKATSLRALYEAATELYTAASMDNIECGIIATANLVTGDLLWNMSITYSDVSLPRPAYNDGECKPLNIIIINDPRPDRAGKQLVVVQHKAGYLFGFDLTDGSLQFKHRSYPATSAEILKSVENGFILYSTGFSSVEMTNLLKPDESWFGEWSERWLGEHLELFTDSSSGMTGALRSVDGRLTGNIIPIEGGVLYSSHYVEGSAKGRYVVFRGTDDSAGIVDTVDSSKSWAVYLVNQTYAPETDNSFTFVDDEMNTFFFVDKHTVTGLSAKDGSFLFRQSLPECGGTITRVTATAFDAKAGMLYLGFDQCVLRVDKEGTFLKTTIKEFIGNSIMLSTKCVLVVSTFGNVMCVPRETFSNKVETLWSVAAGISSSQVKILEYRPGYLVIVRGNRQILVEEATGKPVFYKASPGANPMAVIVDKYLVELTSDIFSVTDLTPDLPMNSRTVAWYSTEYLNPDAVPGYYYLRPVTPLVLPWGVVVLQIEGRLIGYDLPARQFVFNESVGLFNPEEGTLMYIPGDAQSPNAALQNSVIAYNGNVFDARTGKPLALYEMVSGSLDGLLLPSGVTVSQDNSFMYISSLPFHYMSSQSSVVPTPTPSPMPTGATPGPMPPNWTPEGEYPPASTLPPDVTVPNIGCAMEVRSQVALFSSCMYEIILTQQNAGTLEKAKCNDLTPLVTRCIEKWEKTAHCDGSILFLAEVLTSLKTKSAGFPYCTNVSTCVDDGSAKLCAAVDAGIAMAAGRTLYPGFHFPEPADQPPVFDPVPPATEPPAGEQYFQFISTGPAGTLGVPLQLDAHVRDLLSLPYKPTLEIVMMTDNDFVWRFYDPSAALAHSRVLAELLYQNYQRTLKNLGLLACVAVSYVPDKNGTTTTTTAPGPTESTTSPGPTPTPTTTESTKVYSFLVTVKSQLLMATPPAPVPKAFPQKIASLVGAPSPANLTYTSLQPEQHQFVFVWADSEEEHLYSPKLFSLIQVDAQRTASDLGVASIIAQEVTNAPMPTTIPTATSDNNDDEGSGSSGLSGGAIAGIVILVLLVVVVVGGLLYRFVLRKRLRRYYNGAESAYILEDRTLQEKV